MHERSQLKLVVSDVDGTLLTPERVLTRRALAAVAGLRAAGIAFAVTSGRPPRGMRMLVAPLALRTDLAAFNGGAWVTPRLKPVAERVLPAQVVVEIVGMLRARGLDIWVYKGDAWFVGDGGAPHVRQEQATVQFAPTVVADLTRLRDKVIKVVGVSVQEERVEAAERDVRAAFGSEVSAARSQPYYLDITHPEANKGAVVAQLCAELGVSPSEVATIGDMSSDIEMFKRSGLSIAMGNASEQVQQAATRVTAANTGEGFAKAMEAYVLGAPSS